MERRSLGYQCDDISIRQLDERESGQIVSEKVI